MKKTLGIILVLSTFLLTSCSDEEFYEKEFVETIGEVNNPIDDGTNPGDTPCTANCGGGGEDDGNNPTVTYQDVQDSFTQQAGNNKVDILWVVDNSGSMGNEQAALAENFNYFIQEFINKDVDFKMAIATTDNNGNPVAGSIEALTKQKLQDDQAQFILDFKNMIKVGTTGSGTERGLDSSEKFTNNFAVNHFRADAYYIVVYVSDEKDHSAKTAAEYLASLKSWKTSPDLVRAYSIVNMNPNYSGGYAKYDYMSTNTNGYTKDINNDFYQTLLTMGENIAQLSLSFVLSNPVIEVNSLEVIVDGVKLNAGWSFDSLSNAIVFEQSATPSPGANIVVKYKVEQ